MGQPNESFFSILLCQRLWIHLNSMNFVAFSITSSQVKKRPCKLPSIFTLRKNVIPKPRSPHRPIENRNITFQKEQELFKNKKSRRAHNSGNLMFLLVCQNTPKQTKYFNRIERGISLQALEFLVMELYSLPLEFKKMWPGILQVL